MAYAKQLRSARASWAWINRRYYNGKLDRPPLHIVAGWGSKKLVEGDSWGITYFSGRRPDCDHEGTCVYFVDRLWTDMGAWRRATILHEAVHVATGTVDHTSAAWLTEVARLSRMGALILAL